MDGAGQTWSIVERQQFMARIQQTIGFDIWNRDIKPLLCVELARGLSQLTEITPGRYAIKLVSGHLLVFDAFEERCEICPVTIALPG